MHKTEARFRQLLDKQPTHLTPLEKCLRLDRLSCFEMESEISVNPELKIYWFLMLATILDSIYADTFPEITKFPTFSLGIIYTCILNDDNQLDKMKPQAVAQQVREYISVRLEVVEKLSDMMKAP